mgnify:CR=1 FL=1
MCGIIAVLRRHSGRAVPGSDDVLAPLVAAVDLLGTADPSRLSDAADLLEAIGIAEALSTASEKAQNDG